MSICSGPRVVLLVAVLVSACGTVPETQIDAFGKASTTHLKAMDSFFKSNKSVAQVDAKRLESIASEKARYDTAELKCEPLRPLNWSPDDETFFVRDRCAPLLVTFEDDAALFAPTDGGALIPSTAQRLALSEGLRDYAAALSEVATAEDEGELVKNLSGAVTASSNLAKTVALYREAELKPSVAATIKAGGPLATALAESSLERARYQALSQIVLQVEETEAVQTAAQALAIHVGRVENIDLTKKYDAFLDAFDAQQDAANEDDSSVEDRVKALKDFEAATRDYHEADADRVSINLVKIGATHSAIAESFRTPGSLDALIAAQTQILDLVEKADAFVQAAEEI